VVDFSHMFFKSRRQPSRKEYQGAQRTGRESANATRVRIRSNKSALLELRETLAPMDWDSASSRAAPPLIRKHTASSIETLKEPTLPTSSTDEVSTDADNCVDICPSDLIMPIGETYRRALQIEPNMCWSATPA